jgi:hypothetical protein
VSETDFDLVAASLRADAADLRTFVDVLATKLEGALGGRVRVERKGRMLGGAKRVRSIAVELGDDAYELEHDDGHVACRRRTVVRGIALKNDDLTLEEWLDAVSRTLVAEAQATERGRLALERLLDG